MARAARHHRLPAHRGRTEHAPEEDGSAAVAARPRARDACGRAVDVHAALLVVGVGLRFGVVPGRAPVGLTTVPAVFGGAVILVRLLREARRWADGAGVAAGAPGTSDAERR
jgi:hypothetical protein